MEEFVSAMYDGETVPQEAAEHVTQCGECQQLFRSFVEMGAELRRFGSLESAEQLPERTWERQGRTITGLWEKGWQSMRIPRFAFAALVMLVVAVGSRLALVEVRAHEDGPVLLLKIKFGDGNEARCPLSSMDQRIQRCGGVSAAAGGNLSYVVHFLKKNGDRALLSLRSQSGQQTVSTDDKQAETMPETQLWVSSEEATDTLLGGVAKVRLTAQWTDHIPVLMGSNEYLDPSAHELRLTSPLLLKNNQVVGDMEGATALADEPNEAVYLYIPGEGRFVMSLNSIDGAVAGKIEINRISFTSDGHQYVVVTGAPVARGEAIWVKREAAYKPPSGLSTAFLGAAPVSSLGIGQ
ncbi:hypothetical protein HDF16_005711 [Granulicella aggregans]|uniref:Uncharacterized protein n=1 Tax=Granulicella aggregans TaxID=474949 RepID=A0A7W7ZJA5_9BACT|nr:hypothetical protein [Granulicella aggregans]MBB5060975.1 hypothetical protein [Granulicella aggregans]